MYMLNLAVLQVIHGKYSTRGWGQVVNTAQGEAKCCIWHQTPPQVLYFPYITSRRYFKWFYCFALEGSAVAVAMNLKCEEYKQNEEIVSESFLPQECEMKFVTKCKSTLHNNKLHNVHSNKYIANDSHFKFNGKQ